MPTSSSVVDSPDEPVKRADISDIHTAVLPYSRYTGYTGSSYFNSRCTETGKLPYKYSKISNYEVFAPSICS